MNFLDRNILFLLVFLFFNSAYAGVINIKSYMPDFPKDFSFGYCRINISISDINGKVIKKGRLDNFDLSIDDYEEDRKINWSTDTFVDRFNPSYANSKRICVGSGVIWQSQLIGLVWSDIDSWGQPMVSCLNSGLNHKGFYIYKDKQNDPVTKYFSPFHPTFNEVNKACGDIIIRTKLNKDYKCSTNLGPSICEDKLAVMRNGKPNQVTINQAIVAKLNNEEVLAIGYETNQGVSERLSRDEEIKRKAEEAEKRRIWLSSAEGKKYLAEEEAKRKKSEDERIKSEATEKARIAKEFPYFAVISCGIGMGHMTITACFSGEYGSLEIRNGNEYGLYKIVQIINGMIPNSNEQRDGLVVNLRNNFEINARNGEQKNIILGVKVIQRNSGNVVFQKQVDNFGSIRVKN
jgi:hypothetical protein